MRSVVVAAAAAAGACVLATAAAALTPTDPNATHPAAHPELAGAVLPGDDFVDDDTDAAPAS